MKSTIYFNCLVVVLGCLVWTVTAQNEQEFISEKTRLLNIYGIPGVHIAIKLRNLPALIDFLDKYSGRLNLTPKDRLRADRAVRKYRNERKEENLPIQGSALNFIENEVRWIIQFLQ